MQIALGNPAQIMQIVQIIRIKGMTRATIGVLYLF